MGLIGRASLSEDSTGKRFNPGAFFPKGAMLM